MIKMRKIRLFQRIRIWIEDRLCGWMFGRDYTNTVALLNIGNRYAKRIGESTMNCSRCGSVWYPKVGGRCSFDGEAKYCPYCGKHR